MITQLSNLSQKISMLENAAGIFDLLAEVTQTRGFQVMNVSLDGLDYDVQFVCSHGPKGRKSRKIMRPVEAETRPVTNPLFRLSSVRRDPFLWDLEQANSALRAKYQSYSEKLAARAGMTVPLHHARGYVGCLTVATHDLNTITPTSLKAIPVIAYLAMLHTLSIDTPRFRFRKPLRDHVGFEGISAQQLEILRWVAQGKTNREIGLITHLRHRTVDYHLQEILKKLGVNSRAQAVALYMDAQRPS